MRMRITLLPTVVFAAVVTLTASRASATPITFFGQDLGAGEDIVLASTPNADAAQASFLSSLINPGVETFEAFASGSTGPLAINFANGVTATLTGAGSVVSLADGVTNGFGRYGVTGDANPDERFFESTAMPALTLVFSDPVSAFGFYGIDIGDFNGQVTVTMAGGLNQVFNVGNSTNIQGGSVLFWGLIDSANTFTSVTFGNTSGTDIFAFDDFTIGTPEQVNVQPVPEPASLLLLGSGIAGIAAKVRKRRKQQV